MWDIRQGTIRDVHFGMRDFGDRPGLWFTVDFSTHTGTLVVMQGEKMEAFLSHNHVYKIEDLEGKACDVSVDGVRCTFLGLTSVLHSASL